MLTAALVFLGIGATCGYAAGHRVGYDTGHALGMSVGHQMGRIAGSCAGYTRALKSVREYRTRVAALAARN